MRVDRRGVVLVLVAVLGLAAVGLGARGDQGDTTEPAVSLSEGTGEAALRFAGWLFLLVSAAVLVLVLFSLGGGGRRARPRKPARSRLGTIIAIAAVLLLVAFLRRPDQGALDGAPPEAGDPPVREAPAAADDEGRSPAGALAAAGLAVLVVAGITAVAVRSRLQRDGVLVAEDEPVLVATGGATGPTLAERAAAEPDPRRAVLLAFAAAEASLGRPPATSPREWLASAPPHVREPLAELVRRYEIARFSHHAVGDDDRRAALDALGRLP